MSIDLPGNAIGLGWPATPSETATVADVPGSDVGLGWAGDQTS